MTFIDHQWLPVLFNCFSIYFRKIQKCAQFSVNLSRYQPDTNFFHPVAWEFRKRMKICVWPLGAVPISCMVMKSCDP